MIKLKQYALPLLCIVGIAGYFLTAKQSEPMPPISVKSSPIEGVHYAVLDYQEPEAFKGKVVEFFWYSCGHCYKMEKYLETPEMKTVISKWDFEQVHGPYPKGARGGLGVDFNVFALLKSRGLEDTVGKEYMRRIHEEDFNRGNVVSFLISQGLTKEDADTVHSESKVTKDAFNKYVKLFSQEKITGVPTFVVGGKYVVKDYSNMEKIVDYLLTK